MADVTVAQFAEVLKVPVDRLLQQLDQAGIKVDSAEDMISEDAKHELLTHLRRSHGHDETQGDAAPRKITLRRKSQSELKLASPQGGRARSTSKCAANAPMSSARCSRTRRGISRRKSTSCARPRNRPRPLWSGRNTSASRKSAWIASASRKKAGAAATRRIASARPRKRRAARPRFRPANSRSASARAAAAKPGKASRDAVDDKATRYGRQELHIVGDVSSRHKKKKSRDGRRR